LHLITPSDTHEGSSRRRDIYLTTQQTNIPAPGGIRTLNPSKRTAADQCLRAGGNRNRPQLFYERYFSLILPTCFDHLTIIIDDTQNDYTTVDCDVDINPYPANVEDMVSF